jgi:hypothetical protein
LPPIPDVSDNIDNSDLSDYTDVNPMERFCQGENNQVSFKVEKCIA